MTPGARIQAAIELLDSLDREPTPADRLLSGWFRRRRYIGSKDRRAIQGHVYHVLRHRAALDWWLARHDVAAPDGRARMVAAMALAGTLDAFDESRYGPPPLDADERTLAAALSGQSLVHDDQPDWVRGNFPEWLAPPLQRAFGDRLLEEAAGLNREAAVDLRVNTLKADRQAVTAALAAEDIAVEPTPLSPIGLRLSGRLTLPNVQAFRDGLFEVQDEGSQVAALVVDARPGQAVCDLCAGAGGKTLAMAAAMQNQGRIVARDAEPKRMRPMAARLARAGVTIVETDAGVAADAGGFDRVLVDAPCSGSGAWRRNPDARWRFEPDDLEAAMRLQDEILAAAAPLVREGGRLVYITCSVLAEENHVRAEAFLAAHRDFVPLPVPALWSETIGGPCPSEGPFLSLTPARHGTDGFFVAVLERRS